ncbi:hypothetical protein AKJ41_00910 [candidate division MSBL1 archaeon SCGC-AAA259O05]|uniref:Toprim domain-containing protein n=1 Tax=candidate division MSBL1 archaeon SCGC-AAA259O05 TaxID=1698271 RepID=A0A133V573_9EURY|nr:hypothetical protein AKJ41_00910 [candidate division MSBL1 archaeon SCGC-AAA259O05]
MLDPEAFEELEKTLEQIREASAEGVAIIVEGKNDEAALRKLGVSGPIYRVPSGGRNPLNSLSDLADYEEVIVLTDFDEPGNELAVFCERQLEKMGVDVLSRLRDRLRNYVRKAVKDIEGVPSFVRSERISHSENLSELERYRSSGQ